MPRRPCCCGCQRCSSGGSSVLQGYLDASNDDCTSTAGCAEGNSTTVLAYMGMVNPTTQDISLDVGGTGGAPAVEDNIGCYYRAIIPYECATTACDACGCSASFLDEGKECIPDSVDPFYICTDVLATDPVTKDANCDTCENDQNGTANCGLSGSPPYCPCVSSIGSSTGYSCQCDNSCGCEANANGTIQIGVFIYLKSGDTTKMIIAVSVLFNGDFLSGYVEVAATAEKIDCAAIIDALVISLHMAQGATPIAQSACNLPTQITLDIP